MNSNIQIARLYAAFFKYVQQMMLEESYYEDINLSLFVDGSGACYYYDEILLLWMSVEEGIDYLNKAVKEHNVSR